MKFSRDWMAQYVELPESVRELADRLTAAGLAVEGIEESGDDVLLDVDVTTNRPDCMNHFGLAREVAALFDRPLQPPAAACEERGEAADRVTRVDIEDDDCLRYAARVVRDVRVGPSPDWLARRLESIGQRPINNVVDVTNYVLWESGQPIHAFDLDKLSERRIVVRAAREGEVLVTLDGERRELSPEVLVIADAERAVALAGIMGGLDSEVGEQTRNVLIESAHFDRRRVRRGAGLLGLHTDASHRFERGADPEACVAAADRVATLLSEVAGGAVLPGAIDERAVTLPRLRGSVDAERLSAFAGVEIEPGFIDRALAGLGFGVESHDGAFRVEVPSWRYYDFACKQGDEVYEAYLYEEVMRVLGYDAVPAALPALGAPDAGSSAEHELRRRIRQLLAGCGLAEAVNISFHEPAAEQAFASLAGSKEAVRIANPLSEILVSMRRSLLPGLVESAAFNQRRGAEAVRLFEIGRVFPRGDAAEVETVAIVAGGARGVPWDRERELDLFALKGIVEALGAAFGVELAAEADELPGLIAGSSCWLRCNGRHVGYLGRLDDDGFPYPVFAAELTTSVLADAAPEREVRLPSRFPGVAVDLTLTHPLRVTWAELEREILASRPPHLVSFGLKDRYRGKGVPKGAVNTTISFLYNADDRSLTQEEVNESHERISLDLRQRYGWSG